MKYLFLFICSILISCTQQKTEQNKELTDTFSIEQATTILEDPGEVSIDTTLSGTNEEVIDSTKSLNDLYNLLKYDSFLVVVVQQKLESAGYDLGPRGVDGILGPYTKSAIKKYYDDTSVMLYIE